METSRRWTIAVVVAVAIAILLWFLMRREETKPPAEPKLAAQPAAPKAEPPPAPKPAAQPPLVATVNFDYDRAEIRSGDAAKLDEFAARLQGRAYDRLEVEGHADRIGGDAYNLALSGRRAEAVRRYLTGKGVDAGRIRAEAVGEARPLSGGACEKMDPANRSNRKLIECLRPDRRAELVARP